MQRLTRIVRESSLFRRPCLHVFAGSLICVSLSLVSGCGRSPAVGSEEASSSADALYTAVTSRRNDLLDNVETRLNHLLSEGKLSVAAAQSLDLVIQQARSGEWQAAAEILDEFIRDQPLYHHKHSSN